MLSLELCLLYFPRGCFYIAFNCVTPYKLFLVTTTFHNTFTADTVSRTHAAYKLLASGGVMQNLPAELKVTTKVKGFIPLAIRPRSLALSNTNVKMWEVMVM